MFARRSGRSGTCAAISGPALYLTQVNNASVHYNGFNLLAGDLEELHYLSNRGGKLIAIAPGVHGLSNHLLNSPWPKVERGRKILGELLESKTQVLIDGLFKVLDDRDDRAGSALTGDRCRSRA